MSEKAATIATEKAAAEAGARIEQAEKAAQAEKTATKKAATKTYSVKVGDYLSKIADEQDVEGAGSSSTRTTARRSAPTRRSSTRG